MKKVLFTGGRSFTDISLVRIIFDYLKGQIGDFEICHGAAVGLDTLVDEVARERNIPRTPFQVPTNDYRLYGNRAPTMRNQRMLDEFKPDLVVVFPGARGTQDMHNRAYSAGKLILNVRGSLDILWENTPLANALSSIFTENE